uniref:C2 domain-containing protein n=1 Tax=Dunaliella tertiolecta TaxID=3047 RepID=A0A7S3QQ39_DUNTE
MSSGRLCISVIEAQNVLADPLPELSFYVRLRLGHAEVKTDVMKDCISPKFLKDVRMDVPDAKSDVLRIELLQCGPRGDLVVGSDQLQVDSITTKGTVVHWFQLKAADDELAAELCMVLRYLPGSGQRSMTPSFGIAAREAKARALEDGSYEAQSAMRPESASSVPGALLQPSQALFTDLQGHEHKLLQQKLLQQQQQQQQVSFAPVTPAKQQSNPFGRPDLGAYSATESPPGNLSTGSSAPLNELDIFVADEDCTPPVPSSPYLLASAPDSTLHSPQGQGSNKRFSLAQAKRMATAQLPWPLAMVSGMLVGALIYLVKNRPAYDYEVSEGEAQGVPFSL